MSTGAVISLYSAHARNIYAGAKRFEYRTRKPARDVGYLAIYETGRTGAVTGIAKVSGILEGSPGEIWNLTKSFAGISARYFKDYFRGKKKAIAYCISEAAAFDDAVPLEEIGVDRPPQSFQYISEDAVEKLLRRASASGEFSATRYFIGGVHGVGKTTFARHVADNMGIRHYSSSDVIRQSQDLPADSKAIASGCVEPNQSLLVRGLESSGWFDTGGLLDGHFVLRTEGGRIAAIPVGTFDEMALDALFVLTRPPDEIVSQMRSRDGRAAQPWQLDAEAMRAMQEAEVEHAKRVARELGLPLSVIKPRAVG